MVERKFFCRTLYQQSRFNYITENCNDILEMISIANIDT